nr:MAG TPA: hypothetical protein [Caudoviricetes sp.]
MSKKKISCPLVGECRNFVQYGERNCLTYFGNAGYSACNLQ